MTFTIVLGIVFYAVLIGIGTLVALAMWGLSLLAILREFLGWIVQREEWELDCANDHWDAPFNRE